LALLLGMLRDSATVFFEDMWLTVLCFARAAFAVTFGLAVMNIIRERGGMSVRADPKVNMSEAV
jgi:hypothetical protein